MLLCAEAFNRFSFVLELAAEREGDEGGARLRYGKGGRHGGGSSDSCQKVQGMRHGHGQKRGQIRGRR